MSQTLEKSVKSLTPFLLISTLSYQTTAYYHLNILIPSEYTYRTSCDFYETDILQIINSQDSNKGHGYDMISICILKLYDEAICRHLNIICHNVSKHSQVSFRMEKRHCRSNS